MNPYIDLFINSLLSALIIPWYDYSMLAAIKILWKTEVIVPAMISVAGSLTGYAINYCAGAIVLHFTIRSTRQNNMNLADKFSKVSGSVKSIALLAAPQFGMFGHGIMLIYGYMRYDIKIFLALTAISRLLYCLIYLVY